MLFQSTGILSIIEHEKNDVNPDLGGEISFISSSYETCKVKEGLARIFNIEGNRQIIELLSEGDIKYPEIKNNLKKMFSEF